MICRFRPCIDLHDGKVKQIVGGSLRDHGPGPTENYVSERPPTWFADSFRRDGLTGGHVIKLGPGNDQAAKEALAAWPGGLQIGGGISAENASAWLEAGASHVIVTSALFDSSGRFSEVALTNLVNQIGRERLVIDLSCRRNNSGWVVAMNRWQTLTDLEISNETLDGLLPYCDEFLIHAADVEGLCGGVDKDLVKFLGDWAKCPLTYAGGAATLEDVYLVDQLGNGQVDVTVGSALDIFGGGGIKYAELAEISGRKSLSH